jgi:hypothetical protein
VWGGGGKNQGAGEGEGEREGGDYPISPLALLHRHSRNHDHDIIRAIAVIVKIMGGLLKNLVAISGVSRKKLSLASISILGIDSFILVVVYFTYMIRDLIRNILTVRGNREEWLLSSSRFLIILGVLSYHTGDTLPVILQDFSKELHCDKTCVKRGLILGACLMFTALTMFQFIPSIFQKINEQINIDFNIHFIRNEEYREHRMQWFVLRMIALLLDFDVVYTTLWVYTFIDTENCDFNNIIGSSVCILTGWLTYTAYSATHIAYITDTSSIIEHLKSLKLLHVKYQIINVLYYTTLILFLSITFPLHILAGNVEPLSCGCAAAAATRNNSATLFACEERLGVVETRLALFLYQFLVLMALGCTGTVKYYLQDTEYSKL